MNNIILPEIPNDIREKDIELTINNICVELGDYVTDLISDKKEIKKVECNEEPEGDLYYIGIEDREAYIKKVKSHFIVPDFLKSVFKD